MTFKLKPSKEKELAIKGRGGKAFQTEGPCSVVHLKCATPSKTQKERLWSFLEMKRENCG